MLEDLSIHGDTPLSCQYLAGLLGEHLPLHEAAGTDVLMLAGLFAAQWSRHLELMTSDDGATVGVLTQGRGEQFTAQIQSLLCSCEIDPAAADQMLALAAALNHRRCLLQLSVTSGSEPQLEVSVRYRRSMHLDHGLRLLGMDAAASRDVRGCAELLHKCDVSGLTLGARRGASQVRQTVHFTQIMTERRRESVRMRLAHAASRFAPCAPAVIRWAEHHDPLLSPERLALAVAFAPASAGQEAQFAIEYANVPVPAAVRLVEQHAAATAERFEELCARADCCDLSHLEVSLQRSQWPVLQAYASVPVVY